MNESAKAHTKRRPIPESQNPDRDCPQVVSERGLIEPAPRRVRGYVDGTLVFDTTRAHYVWEIISTRSISSPWRRMEYLHDENHVPGTATRLLAAVFVDVSRTDRKSAARLYDSSPVAGSLRSSGTHSSGLRRTSPSSGPRATPASMSTRCVHTATSGSNSTGW